MEAQIQNSLFVARFFRNLNKELKVKCSDEVKSVLKVRRKKTNIEKVVQLVSINYSLSYKTVKCNQLCEKDDSNT